MAKPTLWKSIGAIAKGVVRGILGAVLPIAGIPADWVALALAYYFSDKGGNWGEFAEGLFYATLGDIAEPYVSGVLGGGITMTPRMGGLGAKEQVALALLQG